MDAEIINAIKELGSTGVLAFVTVQVVRWMLIQRKAKKNGNAANGNGQNRRLTDAQPGNPGHSLFDVLDAKIDDLDTNHAAFKKEVREDVKKLFKCVSHIEGVLEIRPPK